VDSDDSEKLRSSYDNYGRMLNEKKKNKMQDRLLKQLKDMPLANRLSER